MVQTLTIDKIPETLESFVEYRNSIATTPEGGAVIMIIAMLKFAEDEDLGIQFLTIALDRYQLSETTRGIHVKGFRPNSNIRYHLDRIGDKDFIARSYIMDTKPEEGYELPALPYKVEIFRNRVSIIEEDKMIKVFIGCTGADTARPVTMQKNDKGLWKAFECSTLFVDTRSPKVVESDDL